MICKRIKPSPAVSQYIREYLLLHLVFDKDEQVPVKVYPVNPKTGITFQFRGKLVAETPALNITQHRPSVNIFGIPSARENFTLTREFMLVNVEFQPLALSTFLNTPLNQLENGSLDASLILGTEVTEINDQLANAESYEILPAILDVYFAKKISSLKYNFRPVDGIAKIIMENPAEFKLDQAAKDSCTSHRTLENIFLSRIGVPPKYYARICRFYQAYEQKELIPGLDWLSIALQNGYTDYQHLVRDFKQFAGVTPNVFIQQVDGNPEKRLPIAPEFIGL